MRSFLIAAILVALGIVTWRHFATDVRGPWGGLTREAPSLPSAFRFPVEEDEESFVNRAARTAREAATDAQSAAEQAGRALNRAASANMREAVSLAAGEAERAVDAAMAGVQDALRDPSESSRSAAEGALAAADHATDIVTEGTEVLGEKARRWWVERALAPASRKLGWHPDFSRDALLPEADQAHAQFASVPPLGLFTLVNLPN